MKSYELFLIKYDCWPYKKRKLGHRHTQMEDPVKTHGEDDYLKTKEQGRRRNEPRHTLIMDF